MVQVEIEDTGKGISKEEISHIFTKFFRGSGAQSDTEGLGIALFISKNIIDRHDGKIWVESEGAGKGSIFSISIPLRK